jgi:hypothetical protein
MKKPLRFAVYLSKITKYLDNNENINPYTQAILSDALKHFRYESRYEYVMSESFDIKLAKQCDKLMEIQS